RFVWRRVLTTTFFPASAGHLVEQPVIPVDHLPPPCVRDLNPPDAHPRLEAGNCREAPAETVGGVKRSRDQRERCRLECLVGRHSWKARASDWTRTTTPRYRLSRAQPRRASPSSSWLPSQPSPSWGPYHGSA